MISLKVLCVVASLTAAESTQSRDEYHTDYYHSVVLQGHVKGGAGPQHRPADAQPLQPSLDLADSPSRRDHYPEYQEYHHDPDVYYAGPLATYHPLLLPPPPPTYQEDEATQERARALIGHHGTLLKGLGGFTAHYGGLVKTPVGFAAHHGKLLHNKLGGGLISHKGFLLGRSAAPSPLPEVPGLIRGGAALAAYNTKGHDKHKLLHGQGAHKYKHFSVDRGFLNPCLPRPFHVVHADHGYDENVLDVGGGGHAGANNVYGLGGKLGVL